MKSKSNLKKFKHRKDLILKADELYCKKNCSDELLLSLGFSYKDITIIKLRWNEAKTFDEIGYEVGLSSQRIRTVYMKMKSKIIEVLTIEDNKSKTFITDQFSARLTNRLKQIGIYGLEDIASFTRKDLLHFNQIGESTVDLIEAVLKQNGMQLKE